MSNRIFEFSLFWLPIIGGLLLGGLALSAWYGGNKILALWAGFFGIISFLLLVTLQIQSIVAAPEKNTKAEPTNRARVSIQNFIPTAMSDESLVVAAEIRNFGDRSATNMRFSVQAFVGPEVHAIKKEDFKLDINPDDLAKTLAPGEIRPFRDMMNKAFSLRQIAMAQQGHMFLQVGLAVKYVDGAGRERMTWKGSWYDQRAGAFTERGGAEE